MPRAGEARRRLTAIDRPVPTPTPEAIALNKKELASRTATTRYERFVNDMGKRPDLSAAVKVGQPTLVDPKETDAPRLVREINETVKSGMAAKSGSDKVTIEPVKAGDKAPANQPAPRSTEVAVNPSDIPATAPSQLNESNLSTSADKPADKAAESSSADAAKDDKNAASSRKAKKKHRFFHLPIPM
jgi:outer membrane protein assembly factor BamD